MHTHIACYPPQQSELAGTRTHMITTIHMHDIHSHFGSRFDGGEGAMRGVWRRVVFGLARMLHGMFCSRVLLVMAVVWVAGSHEDAQQACRYGIRMTFKLYQDVVDEGGDPESAMSREMFQPVWSRAPEWFEQRMATCGLQRPGNGTLRETKKTDWRIIGAMRLTHRGSTFNNGPLTKWSEEGRMLLET